jgi:hypothetical protein
LDATNRYLAHLVDAGKDVPEGLLLSQWSGYSSFIIQTDYMQVVETMQDGVFLVIVWQQSLTIVKSFVVALIMYRSSFVIGKPTVWYTR